MSLQEIVATCSVNSFADVYKLLDNESVPLEIPVATALARRHSPVPFCQEMQASRLHFRRSGQDSMINFAV